MIAGKIMSFKAEDVVRDEHLLIELTDTNVDDKYVEIAFENGKERIYLQFRLSDLKREIKELK